MIVFTSDHGDMCGSHGLRSKGPFVYDEIMRVPCYVKPAASSSGGRRRAAQRRRCRRTSTWPARSAASPGVEPDPGMQGVDLGPLVADPAAAVRDHVLFAHATAHTSNIRATRWAIRGVFDGRHKYARYYGVGGGLPNDDFTGVPTPMLYGPDAAFEDQEHEWYDQQEDPHELVNLAMDNGRRPELRERVRRPARPRGRGAGRVSRSPTRAARGSASRSAACKVVGVILALALLVPIVVSTVAAIGR